MFYIREYLIDTQTIANEMVKWVVVELKLVPKNLTNSICVGVVFALIEMIRESHRYIITGLVVHQNALSLQRYSLIE